MLGKLKLRKRRSQLARLLDQDITQASDWQRWLDGAGSVQELHATCSHPGWLTHCAYLDNVSQDALFDGALGVARLAAEHDPTSVLTVGAVDGIRDASWPELVDRILGLERTNPLVGALVDLVPTQTCYAMMELYDGRIALREEVAPAAEGDPYRTAAEALAAAEADALVAAGFVFALETPFLRHEGLRDALALRAAAAAGLLAGSYAGFNEDACALLRQTYRW